MMTWDDAVDLDYCRSQIVVKQWLHSTVIEWHPTDDGQAKAEYIESHKQDLEKHNRRAAELRAARRTRLLVGPGRAMKQYRNAIRKVGLMAVSEALGLG